MLSHTFGLILYYRPPDGKKPKDIWSAQIDKSHCNRQIVCLNIGYPKISGVYQQFLELNYHKLEHRSFSDKHQIKSVICIHHCIPHPIVAHHIPIIHPINLLHIPINCLFSPSTSVHLLPQLFCGPILLMGFKSICVWMNEHIFHPPAKFSLWLGHLAPIRTVIPMMLQSFIQKNVDAGISALRKWSPTCVYQFPI